MAELTLNDRTLTLTDGENVSSVDLSAIKGDRGVRGIQGKPGNPGFEYSDFTPEQLEALRGAAGADGDIVVKKTATGTALKLEDASDSNIISLEIAAADNPAIAVYGSNLYPQEAKNSETAIILQSGTYYAKRFFANTAETNARLSVNIGGVWKTIEQLGEYDSGNIIVTGSSMAWYEDKQKITLKKPYEIYYGLINGDKLSLNIINYATEYEPYIDAQTVTIPHEFSSLTLNNGVVTIDDVVTDIPELVALHTNKPYTTIICDAPITVSYKADATTAVNNLDARITALEQGGGVSLPDGDEVAY